MGDPKSGMVLAVDDEPTILQMFGCILSDEFGVLTADNGEAALELAAENLPDIIVLDIRMPDMDGYETCQRLKRSPLTRNIPVIFLTGLAEDADKAYGLALGAVDFLTKPVNMDLMKARVRNHIDLKQRSDRLSELVYEHTRELIRTKEATIQSLSSIAECRDPGGGSHIRRTQQYILRIARRLVEKGQYTPPLDEELIEQFCKSAPLHDFGNIHVSDKILRGEGRLTAEEYETVKAHTTLGLAAIEAAENRLGPHSFLRYAREIAASHHERWDGTGYPNGLAGEQIPLCGRLMAIADVYDALISRRAYKPPIFHSTSVQILTEGRGKAFDPLILDAFVDVQEDLRRIATKYCDLEEERRALEQ